MAEIARKQAAEALVNVVRLAHYIGQLQNRTVPVSGFVGSPAHCWSHWFLFPPLPKSLGGHPIPDVYQVSLELLVERFAPVFQACLKYGTTYDLECHPSERAMGDIASAGDYLAALDAAGFEKASGFNFDCSHMEWQGVSGVDFIRAYGDRIHCAHIKGVQVIDGYTRNGLLGGHKPMGDKHNGWNFVTAGAARDATSHRAVAGRTEPRRLQRRRVDRVGRQRRRAACRRQSGAGQRAPRRSAAQRHAARRPA